MSLTCSYRLLPWTAPIAHCPLPGVDSSSDPVMAVGRPWPQIKWPIGGSSFAALCPVDGRDEMSGRIGRHMIGRYGVGTLWCVREVDAFAIQFNAVKIATRSLKGGAWAIIEKGWKVTECGHGQIRVQLNNSEGVIVSLNSGTSK
jgi:hypothetical protein